MKRSTILYSIIAVLVVIISVITLMTPQAVLDAYEYPPYLLFVVIPLGVLWLRAYIDASNGN